MTMKEKISLTIEEVRNFEHYKLRLKHAITPGEAKYYKSHLDSLISIGKTRASAHKN